MLIFGLHGHDTIDPELGWSFQLHQTKSAFCRDASFIQKVTAVLVT